MHGSLPAVRLLAGSARTISSTFALLRGLTTSPTMSGDLAGASWKKEKERLAGLDLDGRRIGYANIKFVPLSDIQTWKQQFKENEKSLLEMVSGKDMSGAKWGMADKVSLFRGDITKLEVDAIVNAANNSLLGGGGVDGAIHRAAGGHLLAECRTLNGCETGAAKITSGYKLPSKNIIHTVGPRGIKPDLLKSCYSTCLDLMVQNNLRSIAFPCISTGIYGYPSEAACPVALDTVRTFLEQHSDKVDRVIFCLFLEKDVEIYEQQMQFYFGEEA